MDSDSDKPPAYSSIIPDQVHDDIILEFHEPTAPHQPQPVISFFEQSMASIPSALKISHASSK